MGKRVCGWPAGAHSRRVPIPPPHGMFHAHFLRGDALDEACVGEDVDELLDFNYNVDRSEEEIRYPKKISEGFKMLRKNMKKHLPWYKRFLY